jgi:hypothetical protein
MVLCRGIEIGCERDRRLNSGGQAGWLRITGRSTAAPASTVPLADRRRKRRAARISHVMNGSSATGYRRVSCNRAMPEPRKLGIGGLTAAYSGITMTDLLLRGVLGA